MSAPSDLEDRIVRAYSVMPLREAVVRLLELMEDAKSGVRELSQCLSTDSALTQRVLEAVNSPLYGLRSKVTTIEGAVKYLGVNALRVLALGFGVARDVTGDSSAEPAAVEFWARSLTSAAAARLLAGRIGCPSADEAYLGGLLQDVGTLAIRREAPREYDVILARRNERVKMGYRRGRPVSVANVLDDLEQEMLGTDHAQVAGRLCAIWHLPAVITRPIRCHHTPRAAADLGQPILDLARILNVSDLVAQLVHLPGKATALQSLERLAHATLGLNRSSVDEILGRCLAVVGHVAGDLQVQVAEPLRYVDILAEVEQEATALKAAQERVARQAADHPSGARRKTMTDRLELERAKPDNCDPLTGVFSRSFFERFLAEELELGRTTREPLTLVVLEIRDAGGTNDALGRLPRDALMVEVACHLLAGMRDSDVVARYGPGQFAVLLIDARPEAVPAIAARLRESLDGPSFSPSFAGPARMSINIGVLSVGDYDQVRGPADVLRAAHRLLSDARSRTDGEVSRASI